MAQSFDDVLKDEPEVKEPEKAEEVKPEPAPEPVKAEDPKDPPKVEESAPTAPERDDSRVPLAALEDERRKRQEWERKAKEYEAKQTQQKAPDPVADPDGFKKHFEEQSETKLLNERLNMSEQIVRETAGDEAVDTALKAFQDEAQRNPGLYQTVIADRHPYKRMLAWHRQQQVLSTVGEDLSAYEKNLREKWLEEAKADPSILGLPPAQTTQPSLNPSLANRPSVGARDSAWTGPTPLGDILK